MVIEIEAHGATTATTFGIMHSANALIVIQVVSWGTTTPSAITIGGDPMVEYGYCHSYYASTDLWYAFRKSAGTDTVHVTTANPHTLILIASLTGTVRVEPFFEGFQTAINHGRHFHTSVRVPGGTAARRVLMLSGSGGYDFFYPGIETNLPWTKTLDPGVTLIDEIEEDWYWIFGVPEPKSPGQPIEYAEDDPVKQPVIYSVVEGIEGNFAYVDTDDPVTMGIEIACGTTSPAFLAYEALIGVAVLPYGASNKWRRPTIHTTGEQISALKGQLEDLQQGAGAAGSVGGAAGTGGSGGVAATPHPMLSDIHVDTTPASVVDGDLMIGQGDPDPTWARLGVGTDGYILAVDSVTHLPSWKAPGAATAHDLLSATHLDTLTASVVAGDLIFGNAAPLWARLGKGTDSQVLTMVAGFPAWADAVGVAHDLLSATHLDTLADSVVAGDLLYGNSTPKWARLAKGTDSYVLTIDPSTHVPSWLPPAGGSLSGSWTELVSYPFGGANILSQDPLYDYTSEVSESSGSYTCVGYVDFDFPAGTIKSIFANLVWAAKETGGGAALTKWQIATGSHASPGSYVDITDEVSVSIGSYSDQGRSGVISAITSCPTATPFTVQCLVKKSGGTSAQAKIKSNTYFRITYKVT
jgi:hypothetical protein